MSDFKCEYKKKQKLYGSFRAAFKGIKDGLFCERNFQIHLFVALLVIVMGFVLSISLLEWAVIVLSIVLVMATELINTALEILIDYFNPDIHPVIGKVKDMVAGSVLIVSIGSFAVGMIIFLPKLLVLLGC